MFEDWKLWEGKIVDGRFPLEQYLGAGTQSAVFRTKLSDEDGRPVAIKLIPGGSSDSGLQLAQLERAAQLSHPNLIGLLHYGRCRLGDTDLLYVVMEYADEDLGKVLSGRPLTAAEAREMVEPVLNALAYIHGAGFVHGHMKPANVMAVSDSVKISSDAICRAGEPAGSRRNPSVYDPPELKATGASPAADVWSLGVTLVEALTQRLPNRPGSSPEPAVLETLPVPFRGVVVDCLQADPGRRPAAAAILARLRPAPSEPVRESAVRPRETSSRSRYLMLAATAAIVLAAVFAGQRLFRQPAPLSPPERSGVQPGPTPKEAPKAESRGGEAGTRDRAAPSPAAIRPEPTKPSIGSATGMVIDRVLPEVPRNARQTVRGTVRVSVRVDVDSSGKVVRSSLDSAGPSKYFAGQAMQAARRWKFRPPQVQGRNVPSEWILRFSFTRAATEVRPVQVSP